MNYCSEILNCELYGADSRRIVHKLECIGLNSSFLESLENVSSIIVQEDPPKLEMMFDLLRCNYQTLDVPY